MDDNFISAVIYVYNNEEEIEKTLQLVNDTLKKKFKKYEIICVNDCSTDKSVKLIEKFSKTLKTEVLSVVNMSFYQGIEIAMNAGVDLAIGDFVYEFDKMISEREANYIIELYDKCLAGYDIVSVSTKSNKSILAKYFYKIFNKYSNIQYKINTETFRILSRRAINKAESISCKIQYRKAVYANCGLKVCNIVHKSNENILNNKDKEIYKSRKLTAEKSLILFTNIGYRISLIMISIMLIISIFVLIYTLYIFFSGHPVEGWTTTMLFLSIAFTGMFTVMAIIIKYLDTIIDLIFKKNKYTIESIEKLN